MAAGTIAQLPARFNCHGCDYRPQRIEGDKFACPRCGLVQWDAVALVKRTFPGATLLIAKGRTRFDPVVDDWEIERMLDR